MSSSVEVVFLWHMHQPDYRDPEGGDVVLPWVSLHAIKDYTDMAAHLERHPKARAVVNFVPVLVEQLLECVQQIKTRNLKAPLLRLLIHPDLDQVTLRERRLIVDSCFSAHYAHMMAPFPQYQRLHDVWQIFAGQGDTAVRYLSGAYLSDLVTWYHLAWMGESERRQQPLLVRLMSQGENFGLEDRQALLDLIGDLIAGLVPRYRALAERGQIELSATPYAHPIGPLLLDLSSAREAMPDIVLPLSPQYSGGRARFNAHIAEAFEAHQSYFGLRPQGFWPAEGALSPTALFCLNAANCRWTASGGQVLQNTLARAGLGGMTAVERYRPWQSQEGPTVFFRDDVLSDLIGFEYARWHGRDAARHFVNQLEDIAERAPDGETPLVVIALDGENAWEHYPYNAYYFFSELYSILETSPVIRTTTFADVLNDPVQQARTRPLPPLVSGSWVYGTLSTWIGDPDKNRAWDLLCSAKQTFDLVMSSGRLSEKEQAQARERLSVCEGSDWFWWFGDYNPGLAVANFESLYRRNLKALYQALLLPAPHQLDEPLSIGGGAPAGGGTMRRSTS